MSRFSDDRLLWLTVAAGLAVSILYIPATLERIRTLTEVHDDEEHGKRLSNDAEAALKPEVLRILVDGPSYELRASAIKIVAARALQDDTKKILLRDLASKNADDRGKAINVIAMLLNPRLMPNDNPMLAAEAFCNLAGFTAIVDALINCLPLHDIAAEPNHRRKSTQVPAHGFGPVSPLLPPNRPADEKRLMEILHELLRYDMPSGSTPWAPSQAGIIKRWLNVYPFPCAQPTNSHLGFCRSDVISLFSDGSWANDDQDMQRIIYYLNRDPEASKQFRECGLKASSYREVGCGTSGWSELPARDILMTNSEDTAGLWTHTDERPGSSWARQAPERSPEEDNLRRRHREAIVVAERGAPVTRENILQRQNSQVGLMPLSDGAQELLRVFQEDVATPLRRVDQSL